MHVRHEEVAAFAAGAEAHLTGELAARGLRRELRTTQSTVCLIVIGRAGDLAIRDGEVFRYVALQETTVRSKRDGPLRRGVWSGGEAAVELP